MKSNEPKQTRSTLSPLFTRRRMMKSLAVLAAAVFVEMRFIEPNWIGVGRHKVPILPRGSAPIRILQMSDFHVSNQIPLDFIDHAVDIGLIERPDLVCLTGDFITTEWNEWDAYSRILERLSQAAPTFASTGNHDGGDWLVEHGGYSRPTKVIAMLEKANIQVLMNHRMDVVLPDKAPFELVGLGDIWANDFQPMGLLEPAQDSLPRVLMSHNPDTKDRIEHSHWDLMLSGHTHGGQLTLPWGSTPFAPIRDKRFVRGLHRWRNHWLHITKGVGSMWNMRLNCFPEISIVELTAEQS